VCEKKGKDYVNEIVSLIRGKYAGSSGIIYCMTKKETESLVKELRKKKVNCDYYHAS
jgi:superfamily II DNA helicase RecQ